MRSNGNFRNKVLPALAVALALGGIAQSPVALAQAAAPATAVAQMAPDALVKTVSSDVLDAIKKDKAIAGDMTRLQALVDERILPYVNFERMTRLAVGRGWSSATPEQRQALIKEFRVLLVRTYSGAVSAVRDHQVLMKPFRGDANDKDAIVRTMVAPSKGDPIQLDYRLEKGEQGWKIYDVNVLGVWLVENYRNEFASRVSNEGIDGLIKALQERNRSSAASDAKKS